MGWASVPTAKSHSSAERKSSPFARQAVGSLEPDLLFLSCTNFPAMHALPALNRAFNFLVVTSNQFELESALYTALQPDQ